MKVDKSFKFKSKFLNNTNYEGITNTIIAVPLKYLNYFWRSLEMLLINCEISIILTSSANSINSEITDTKLYVPVVILSNQDNTKLPQQLKSAFNAELTRININQKY